MEEGESVSCGGAKGGHEGDGWWKLVVRVEETGDGGGGGGWRRVVADGWREMLEVYGVEVGRWSP